ncbi:hypothetical protein HMI01_17930 [Halolactibacillus miurensis]|uniref:Two-component response regulator, SAPR family, consists of REC, wHTH and BTAD domains n=1 Tax=Halolactibacillus miurensis TaxID=306541 RepID=A0A1I6NZM1_9BACI|nr:response regulator [Halolactibacillus miurensis]GEM04805.1 hypothetical protein HMI01_17930 [Halolactibacillus miurensis]SFS33397.1 Two-component response regulator, SAPR family, consists of REC, wHTH and BTAD domains [Halolactibacillus miurensis]
MKLLLLDDERMAIEHMKYLLNKSEVIKSVSMTSFLSPTDALKWMEDNIVDVIFIDIEMPEMDGLVVANKMKDIQPNLEIVFVTAFQEYAVEAFELHALDYLLKPVRLQRMDQTLLRIERRLQEKVNEQITLSSTQSIHLLGKVSIESSGQPIDFKWRKGRVKELFLLLLHSRHRAMSKFDIIDYIWSDLSDKKASTQLHMTIYRLRQIINTFNLDLSIEFQDEAYQMLLGKTATVDVDRWLDHINHYPTIHSDNLDHAIDALSLVKGDYMQNLEYSWAQNEQVYLKNSYLKRLIDIASFLIENKKEEEAINYFEKVIFEDPYNDVAKERLLRLYEKNKQGQELKRFTKYLVTVYTQDQEHEQIKELNDMYQRILTNMKDKYAD